MAEILDTAKDKMTKTISVMTQEYASLRAGRANPQALDRILVDYPDTRIIPGGNSTLSDEHRKCLQTAGKSKRK